MIEWIKRYRYVVFLIALQVVVFHRWVFQDALFTFGDVGVLTPENQRELLTNALSIYASDTGLGGLSVGSSTNPLLFVFGILSSLGLDYAWSMKLVIFYPTIFGVVLSSYFLIRKLCQSEGAACIGALAYAYGTYFLITLTGALYLSLAYALAPLILLSGIHLIERSTLMRRIALALSLALVGYIEFRILYISVGILVAYFLFYCAFAQGGFWRVLRRHILDFLSAGMLFMLLNLFWVLPLVLAGKISSNQLFSRGLFGDSYFDIVNAFALFHPWWTGAIPAIFHKQEATLLYFLPVFLALLTFFVADRRRVLPFLSLLLVGIFLTKQSGAPFEPLYRWFYDVFPGFNAFREASKFFYLSTLATAVLIGYLVRYRDEWTGTARIALWAILFLLIVGIGLQAWTVGSGSLGTMFIPREYPAEYHHLNQLLDTPGYSRVLWFPHSNRFGAYSNEHPSLSLLLGMETDFREYIDPTEKDFVESLYSPFTNPSFGAFLRHASVRSVVVPSNLKWDDIKSPWKNSANYTSRLDVIPYLKKIEDRVLTEGGITLYEVTDYLPHLYLTSGPLTLNQETVPEPLVFRAMSPTEYRLTLHQLRTPVMLHFGEKYHPDWRLRSGTFRWFDALVLPDYDLPSMARRNVFGLTSFVIDPAVIKEGRGSEYRENPDGSIDVTLTLYFASQKYFLGGLFIGVSTLLLCFFLIVYTVLKGDNGLKKSKSL